MASRSSSLRLSPSLSLVKKEERNETLVLLFSRPEDSKGSRLILGMDWTRIKLVLGLLGDKATGFGDGAMPLAGDDEEVLDILKSRIADEREEEDKTAIVGL